MPQFAGKNLSITIGGTAVPCPQSFTLNEAPEFVKYYCVGSDGKQKIYDGTDWTGSVTFFPDATDYSELESWKEGGAASAAAIVVYPDGSTAGNIMITCDAWTSIGMNTGRGTPGSVTVNLEIDGSVTFAGAPT